MPPQIDKTIPLDGNENIEESVPSDHNQNVFNIQKYLLILIFIQWFVFVITLAGGIYSIFIGNSPSISSGITILIPIIVLTIYYTFGLLVTYKQNRVGLLIFASIGVILFIIVCIAVGYFFLAVTALSVGFGSSNQGYELVGFLWILFIVVAIVMIITLKFSFDLAKSIKKIDYSTV